jgi:MoaA/NifB/PqqE/SkfB family radical SAM enzyme
MGLKERNKQLLREDIEAKRCIVKAYPYFIGLATDLRCNLNCIMCNRARHDPSVLENMYTVDEKLFIKFADEVFPTAELLQLNIAGEPLTSRNIDLELEYAAKYDVKLEIVTNGVFLDSQYRGIDTLLRQARNVVFSFDSPFKEMYESIRRGADYNRVINNMIFFQKYRNSLPLDQKPSFAIAMVLMKRNLNEVLPMIEFAKKVCADHLSISHMVAYSEEMKKESVHDMKEEVNTVLTKAVAKAHEMQLPLSIPPLYVIEKEESKDFVKRQEDGDDIKSTEKINKFCFFL